MEHNELVYSGFLLFPPAGKIVIKKTWQQKYCQLYKASKFGIERLEVYDSSDTTKNTPSRIITLENCIKITCNSPTHFTVTTKIGNSPCVHEFGATTMQLKNEWINALQAVAFPDDISLMTSIQEDNDLYCSSDEGIFHVKIHPSPASERCGLNGVYTLLLTSTAIQLRNTSDSSLLYTWPYRFIRRYGYKSGKFTFEAGRKCDSGEGTFFLEHSNQREIFRCLETKMKSMKKLLKEDSSPAILDCGENQFHAALSMEARSRSPLPPSPTTSTSLHDIEPNISSKTQLAFLDSSDNSLKLQKPTVPNKPPRKSLNIKQPDSNVSSFSSNTSSINTYEPVDKYDRIEYRSDAWRTMGVNEINHTEKVGDAEDEEEYESWGTHLKNSHAVKSVAPVQMISPKIITQPSVTSLNEANYDKLNFFGSSSKLNLKSGYKQIAMASPNAPPCPPSFNDYDEVQPAMESVRLADDSHLGYALIRKEPPKEKDENVSHHFHNNEPYAVISKPKRV